MSKLTTNQIRDLARKIIAARPGGIRYSELVQEIAAQGPETPLRAYPNNPAPRHAMMAQTKCRKPM